MASLLNNPPRLPLILPSILSADFARLGQEVAAVLDAGADGLHVDVMDGHFVPNLTMGPAIVKSLRKAYPQVYLDVHLMVTAPADFVEPFVQAGANCVSFHAEVVDAEQGNRLIEKIHAAGAQTGIVFNPPTDAAAVDPFIEAADMVLVMSVNPGFSGQSFMAEVLDKTRAIAPRLREDQRLQMDGGVNGDSVAAVRDAGCDCIVAASYIFGSNDYAAAIQTLRGAS